MSHLVYHHRNQRLIQVLMKGKPLIIWKETSSLVMLCLTILQGQMFRCVTNNCVKIPKLVIKPMDRYWVALI